MPATPDAPRAASRFERGCRLIFVSFFGLVGLGQPVSGAVPKGVFSLSAAGNPCRESILANPNVDGISIRQDWKELEPTEGIYDWTFLDSEVGRVAAAGKLDIHRSRCGSDTSAVS